MAILTALQRRAFFATSTCLLLLFSSSFTIRVDAQSFTPIPTWGSAFAFQEGRKLYVQGGSDGNYNISQTFSIDLSTSWDTSRVPFTRLADGPFDYLHSSAMLKNNESLFLLSKGTGYQYSIALDSWKTIGSSPSVINTRRLPATTDPDSGLIYIPNMYAAGNGTGVTQMFQYDVLSDVLKGVPMNSVLLTMASYSIAWSLQLKKMIVFGGTTAGTNNVNNNMYTWDSVNSWVVVTPKGDVPSPRRSACMVSAYGGSKMILYGGLTDQSNSVLSDIYILDSATMTWTKGTDAGVASARAETVCAVTNDLFVSWGGGGVKTVITSNMTIVYNIKKNAWQSTYSPIPEPSPSGGAGGGGAGGSSGSKSGGSNMGAIIGGAVGGVAVIAAVVGCLVYRNKKNRKDPGLVSNTNQFSGMPPATGTAAATMAYAPVSSNAPEQYDPWQQQQSGQQMAMAMSTPPPLQPQPQPIAYSQPIYTQSYTPYQPPIVHDYHQQQQPPQIFQPQTPSTQHQGYPIDDSYHQQNMHSPSGAATVYSPHLDGQQTPTIYQPSDGSVAVSSPALEPFKKPESPPVLSRPPQNPQLVTVPNTYVDSDGGRRNPQGQ
ncbi:hypothetical protein BGX27_007228 [Mortierella sp. AM989]|nr:hypothetical protein BGX27_007228 [Mortierella sp. AM989]